MTKLTLNNVTKTLFAISLAVFLFGSGFKTGEYKAIQQKKAGKTYTFLNIKPDEHIKTSSIDFSLFWDTWEILHQKYVNRNKLDPTKMFYGAIKGMVASLEDPYTIFLTPEENEQSKDDLKGEFEGIGAQLGLKDSKIVIIAPLKESPAEKAGAKAGDLIIKVDGKSTEKWTLQKAVSVIRGEKGTKVVLTVKRDSKEIGIEIVRDTIKVNSVELTYEKDIAILTLTKFGDDTALEWNSAVQEIQEKWEKDQLKGMVLDVRNNPGGYIDGSINISSEFLPEGSLVVKQEYSDISAEEHKVTRKGRLLDIPLICLINEGSASASEIVAGALKDHKRATLVGEKSFGKGSVQEAMDLEAGAGLHVTIAKWILPGGDWINEAGVSPSVEVENEFEEGTTLTREKDKQLEKALELLIK